MKVFAFLRPVVTLLLITALVALALAGVNSITAERIAALQAEKLQAAIAEVLPGGYDREIPEFIDDTGLVSGIYAGANGYAVEVKPLGFAGEIVMMVGVSPEGRILGVAVVSQTETAGLGAEAAAGNAKGEAFRGQFVGKGGQLAVIKDGGDIDAISGATITSRAVTEGVNAAVKCVTTTFATPAG